MDPQQQSHEAAWSDWLGDDLAPKLKYAAAEAETLRPAAAAAAAVPVAATPAQPRQKATIQIDVKLPKLKLPAIKAPAKRATASLGAVRAPALPYRRLAAGAFVLTVVAAGGTFGYGQLFNGPASQAGKGGSAAIGKTASSAAAAGEPRTEPTFQPLAPASKAQLASVDADKTAYDGDRNTFSYRDIYLGTDITVSQQPVPASKSATDLVDKAAKALKATQAIPTAKGTAYMATDAKSNLQTIVYGTDDILMFIQSPFKKEVPQWTSYLNNLK